jgi:acetate kinase
MKILTLNCGSSSVKYALVEMPFGSKLCYGIVDRVLEEESSIEHYYQGEQSVHHRKCRNHTAAIEAIVELISDREAILSSYSELSGVGHRVVHGGEKFTGPTLIDETVIRAIEAYSDLAPLHNPANIAGINAAMRLMPGIPNVAVFDTAFFSTMPAFAFIYGLPYEWYERYRIRKYGFHGTSHYYISRRAAEFLGKKLCELNIITLHIGNGVSVTALKQGKAMDHSMGCTPLEGAIMGTRCGDIDPAIPLYVMRKEYLSAQDMENILNKRSGLLGITGKYKDRRDILEAMEAGDARARLAFDMECYRLKKYIGAYIAALGRIDAIVFSGGVGERSFLHRERICQDLEHLGIRISDERNRQAVDGRTESAINDPDSVIGVLVIPTDEEIVLAQEVYFYLK